MTEFTRRQLRGITKLALSRVARDSGEPRERELAAAALAQLDSREAPPRETIWEHQVQPHLYVMVEDSTCILLELRGGLNDSELIARTDPVNRAELTGALELAHVAAERARADADAERAAGLREVLLMRRPGQPGENVVSRNRAAQVLIDAGLDAGQAHNVLRRAYGHLGASFNVDGTEQLGTVTYDREAGEYAVQVPERGASCSVPGMTATLTPADHGGQPCP